MKKRTMFLVLTLFSLLIMGCKRDSVTPDEIVVPPSDEDSKFMGVVSWDVRILFTAYIIMQNF